MNTQEKFLQVAQELVVKKGVKSVTVCEVASLVGVTHQASYKYFKSKKQLMERLAQTWLDEILAPVFDYQAVTSQSLVHDWLWTLSSCKKRAYSENPEMFKLYTHYISENAALEAAHNAHLAATLLALAGKGTLAEYTALIEAFIVFQHPQFAPRWGADFQEKFEAVWRLVAGTFER